MVRQELCVVMQDAVITPLNQEFVFVMGQGNELAFIKNAIMGLLIPMYVT